MPVIQTHRPHDTEQGPDGIWFNAYRKILDTFAAPKLVVQILVPSKATPTGPVAPAGSGMLAPTPDAGLFRVTLLENPLVTQMLTPSNASPRGPWAPAGSATAVPTAVAGLIRLKLLDPRLEIQMLVPSNAAPCALLAPAGSAKLVAAPVVALMRVTFAGLRAKVPFLDAVLFRDTALRVGCVRGQLAHDKPAGTNVGCGKFNPTPHAHEFSKDLVLFARPHERQAPDFLENGPGS